MDSVLKLSIAAAVSRAEQWRCRICRRLVCHPASQRAKRLSMDRAELSSTRETIFAVKEKAFPLPGLPGGLISVSRLITSIRDFAGRGGQRPHLVLTSLTRRTRFIHRGLFSAAIKSRDISTNPRQIFFSCDIASVKPI